MQVTAPIQHIIAQPNGNLILFIQTSLIHVYNIESKELISLDLTTSEKVKEDTKVDTSYLVRDIKFSKDGNKVAIVMDNKITRVYKVEDWKVIYERTVIKRATAICFDATGNEIAIADKFGDAYKYDISQSVDIVEPIVGHVSVLLDVLISHDNKYIFTSDRDEKVRISQYPNGYNIEGYLLGHTSYVSKICLPQIENQPLLISGGGDNSIILFNYEVKNRLHQQDLSEYFKLEDKKININNIVDNTICNNELILVAVTSEDFNQVTIFSLDEFNKLNFYCNVELPANPISITFNKDSQLWVSLESKEHPVTVYQLNKEKKTFDKKNDVKFELFEQYKVDEQFKLPKFQEHRKFLTLNLPEEEEEEDNAIRKKKTMDH